MAGQDSSPETRSVIFVTKAPEEVPEFVEGDDQIVDRRIWELEGLDGPREPRDYTIEESATPRPAYGGRSFSAVGRRRFASARTAPLSPEDLQSFEIEQLLMEACTVGFDPPQASRLSRGLRRIGVFTCADALALGSRQMGAWAASASERSEKLGEARCHTLGRLLLQFTGHELSQTRPSAKEWPRFYADINLATPALALPMAIFSWYGALRLRERQTIGSLRGMSLDELAASTPSTSADQFGRFVAFIHVDLATKVLGPYALALAGNGEAGNT